MATNPTDFLDSILGAEGTQALLKSTSGTPALQSLFVPQAISCWLNSLGYHYDAPIPGLTNSWFTFMDMNKDNTYSGFVKSETIKYEFNSVPTAEVVAVLAMAIGVRDFSIQPFKGVDLSTLSKNIDSLITLKTKPAPNLPSVKLFNHELNKICSTCKNPYISNSTLSCKCLAKSESSIKQYPGYVVLSFGRGWTKQTVTTFTKKIKG